MPRARSGRPTLDHCKGGLTRRGSTQGGVELGGHEWTRNARGAHGSRSPDPLACLERLDGRRSPSIMMMVVMLALHHGVEPAQQGGRIVVVAGNAAV